MPPLWLSLARLALRIGLVLAVALAITQLTAWLMIQKDNGLEGLTPVFLALILLAYAALIAVPFVPGIEIGVALLMLQGAAIAPLVYAATALGLITAFAIGRLTPERTLANTFADLRLNRARDIVIRITPLTPEERLRALTNRLPKWLGPLATRYRYITLAALLNIPGNAVIGGGGGICLLAGLSRLYGWRGTTLTILIAIAPVPLIVWAMGSA